MANYSNTQSYNGSPERFNPIVQERKHRPETDWAELVRYHQAVAYHMQQQENNKRMMQQHEFRQANGSMMDEKQHMKYLERQAKQQEGVQVATSKEEYEQYLLRAKNDKTEFQKGIAAEYDRERQDREDMRRNMVNNDRQMEQRIVDRAFDSLDRERALNEQKKSEFVQMTDQTLREAEARKRREQEYARQNRQEHNRLMDENSYQQDMKELNYKLYYQRISDQQDEKQRSYDRRAGHEERSRDNHIQNFVNKGVVDATRKAAEEAMRRQAIRDEQFKSTVDDVRSRIENHEQEKLHQKQEHQMSVEQRKQREQEIYEQNQAMKQLRSTQVNDYKSTLDYQNREADDIKRRQREEMSEYEKRTLLQNYEDALIPGLRSSKFDALIAPQLKTTGNFPTSSYVPMPQFNSSVRGSVEPGYERTTVNNQFNQFGGYDTNNQFGSTAPPQQVQSYPVQVTQQQAPQYANSRGIYNPITNPVPNNLQNPYLVKEFQKGMFSPRNYLAVMADKNLIASAHLTK